MIYIFAFSLSAQIEQQLISERTKLGIQARRDRDPSFRMGRKKGSTKANLFKNEIIEFYNRGFSCPLIAKELQSLQIRNRKEEDKEKPLIKISPKTLREYINRLISTKEIKKRK